METVQKILEIVLKDITVQHTVSSIAKETKLSRVGAWKILKKLELDKLIILRQVGAGKTSTFIIELNWSNVLTEKNLEAHMQSSHFQKAVNSLDGLIA